MRTLRDKLNRRTMAGLLVVIALVATGSSIAVRAAIPTTTGVVQICYQTSGGQARVIDTASESCSGSETAVDVAKATPGDFVTNLANADFTGVSLAYRNFANIDMHSSTFNQTSFRGSDFRSANLSGSLITSIIDMSGTNLTGANFNSVSWVNGGAINADLRQITLSGAQLGGGTFEKVNFSGYDFSGIHAFGVTFGQDTNLAGSDFTDAYELNNLSLNADGVNFTNTDFSGAGHIITSSSIHQSTMTGADFTDVQFKESNFAGTDFSNAVLTGVTWLNVICPDNTNSDNNGNTCAGHLVP